MDIEVVRIPQLPTHILRLPKRDSMPAVITNASVHEMLKHASFIKPYIDVKIARLFRCQITDKENLIPYTVFVHIVDLQNDRMSVRLFTTKVAAHLLQFFKCWFGIAWQVGIHHRNPPLE